MPHLRVLCDSGGHCEQCRAQDEGGERWRATVAKTFTVPADWPACPEDRPWGVKPSGCLRCESPAHALADCPIPVNYDVKHYALDAGGSPGCNCAADGE